VASVTPPTNAEGKIIANIIGTASLIWWALITVGIVDLVLLKVDAQTDPALSTTLGIPETFLVFGLLIRVMLIIYGAVTTGNVRLLFDVKLDLSDMLLFGITVGIGLIGVIVINLVSVPIYNATFGAVVGAAFLKRARPKKEKLFKSHNKHAFLLMLVVGLVFLGGASSTYAQSLSTPVHHFSFTVQPDHAKLEGFLEGIAEESFFRGGLLPMIMVIGVAAGAPLVPVAIVAVLFDESTFTIFHGFVYGMVGSAELLVFLSGIILAGAYLFPIALGKPARLDALMAVHAIWDYGVS
jgi:hypothetical protein